MPEMEVKNRSELLGQLYLVSYVCIYLRYLLDKSLLLGLLQLSILYTLTLTRRLCEEEERGDLGIHLSGNEQQQEESGIIKLLVLKCLRTVQLLVVCQVTYCILIRWLYPIPRGRTILVLFIKEFDGANNMTELYIYKLYCLLYIFDGVLLILPLIILNIAIKSIKISHPTATHGHNGDIDTILQLFQTNCNNKYGILALLGTNLFLDSSSLLLMNTLLGEEEEEEEHANDTLGRYGSIPAS